MYRRESQGVEFERMTFFTDAVFAIAMTLLVVAIAVPSITDSTSKKGLFDALTDKKPEFLAFFIGFAVLGNYWFANHRFVSRLKAISPRLLMWCLVYLGFVAWLPFPTALLGRYGGNAVAVTLFAISSAIVSGLESVMMFQAQRDKLFRNEIPSDAFRYAVMLSTIPVVSFLVSVPFAFVKTYLAVVLWLSGVPVQALLTRFRQPASYPDAFDAE